MLSFCNAIMLRSLNNFYRIINQIVQNGSNKAVCDPGATFALRFPDRRLIFHRLYHDAGQYRFENNTTGMAAVVCERCRSRDHGSPGGSTPTPEPTVAQAAPAAAAPAAAPAQEAGKGRLDVVNAVGVKHKDVPRFHRNRYLVVLNVVEQAQRNSGEDDGPGLLLGRLEVNRIGQARV